MRKGRTQNKDMVIFKDSLIDTYVYLRRQGGVPVLPGNLLDLVLVHDPQ